MTGNLIYKLEHQHKEITEMCLGISENFLVIRHLPDKWSIHENLAHLARYQEFFLIRLEAILKKDNPKFDRYIAESDPEFRPWVQKSPGQILREYSGQRQNLIRRILNLTESQLSRTGTHPKFGTMNIAEWVRFFLLHESHHTYTIFQLIREFHLP